MTTLQTASPMSLAAIGANLPSSLTHSDSENKMQERKSMPSLTSYEDEEKGYEGDCLHGKRHVACLDVLGVKQQEISRNHESHDGDLWESGILDELLNLLEVLSPDSFSSGRCHGRWNNDVLNGGFARCFNVVLCCGDPLLVSWKSLKFE
jgi:hypothetical protein